MMNMQNYIRLAVTLIASLLLAACNGGYPDADTLSRTAGDNNTMVVYHDPSCGCCTKWIEHMKKSGFNVRDIRTTNMDVVKGRLHVPDHLMSCHTAIIGGYVIEGHVPAADVKRLLEQRPDVQGLSVPGMPLGSPGMEYQGREQPYNVLLFNTAGDTAIYNHYPTRL
jgi:hypothetical protein